MGEWEWGRGNGKSLKCGMFKKGNLLQGIFKSGNL